MALVPRPARSAVVEPIRPPAMPRIAGPLLACALVLANAPAHAQAGATPATPEDRDASTAGEPRGSAQVPTVDDVCRALEQSAGESEGSRTPLQRQNLAKQPAHSGLFSENREISVRTRMRGGPGRCGTSTAHQGLTERCGGKSDDWKA